MAPTTITGFTIAQIIDHLRRPPHKVRYIVTARGFKEDVRIGNCRLFSATQVDRIREELDAMDGRKVRIAARN